MSELLYAYIAGLITLPVISCVMPLWRIVRFTCKDTARVWRAGLKPGYSKTTWLTLLPKAFWYYLKRNINYELSGFERTA